MKPVKIVIITVLSVVTLQAIPPVITMMSPLPSAVPGVAYAVGLQTAYNPASWAQTGGTLPSWASFNTSTGVISGTPPGGTVGTITTGLVFTATNSDGTGPASVALSLSVVHGTAISLDPLPQALVGTSYSAQLVFNNNPTSWAQTAGTLPSWASFDTSTGVISSTRTLVTGDIGITTGLTFTASSAVDTSLPATFTLVVFAHGVCRAGTGSEPPWVCDDAKVLQPALTATEAAILNGRALQGWTYSGTPPFACGDTVQLAAGAQYLTWYYQDGIDLPRSLHLHIQTGCGGNSTRIVSSALGSVVFPGPAQWKALLPAAKSAYLANMAQIVPPLNGEGSTVQALGAANNYYFGGIAFMSPPVSLPAGQCNTVPNCWSFTAWNPFSALNSATTTAMLPNQIELDRCFIGSSEEFTYGMAQDWYRADGNAQGDNHTWPSHFSGTSIAGNIEGDYQWFHNNIISESGFDPTLDDPEFTCTGGVNSNPARVTCPGWSAGFATYENVGGSPYGLTPDVTDCYPNGPSNPPVLNNCNCYKNNGAGFGVFTGARGGWGTTATDGSGIGKLNGAKLMIAVPGYPDDAYLYEGWRPNSECGLLFTSPIDSTAWGTFTGTVRVKNTDGTSFTNNDGLVSTVGANHVKVENNFIGAPGWTLFTGAGWVADDNRGDVVASAGGCTTSWNNLCLVLRTGSSVPQVGDWLYFSTVNNPVRANNCPAAGVPNDRPCAGGFIRTGIVTAVTGTSPNIAVALTGYGAGRSATDSGAIPDVNTATCPFPEQTPGTYCAPARWEGRNTNFWKITGNVLYRQPMPYGKGIAEFKSFSNSLFSGNWAMSGANGNYFANGHQQGENPWNNFQNAEWSYNLSGDPDYGGSGSSDFNQAAWDPESSSNGAGPARLLHNLVPDNTGPTAGAQGNGVFGQITQPNFTVAHNTFLYQNTTAIGSEPFLQQDNICVSTPLGYAYDMRPYGTAPNLSIVANLFGYANGLGLVGQCDSLPTGINNNVFTNELSADTTPTWIASQGNSIAGTTKASPGFIGTCDFAHWESCALSGSSAFKGGYTDGSDPGADVLAVKDKLNGWSETAGIISYNESGASWQNNPSAWSYTTTTATLQFTSLDPSPSTNCSFHVYNDLARTTENADTSGGNAACNRSGNTVSGTSVTLVLGHHSALSPSTTYAYSLSNGTAASGITDTNNNLARVMVGTFTTAATLVCGINPSGIGTGTVGEAVSYGFTENGNCGAGPFTWTVSSGSLPAGTSGCGSTTGTSCTAAGTLTSAGTVTFNIHVTDGGSNSADYPATVVVNSPPTISTSSPLPAVSTTAAYSQTLASTGGTGTILYMLTGGSLSGAGLSLSGSTLSGTAGTAATYSFTITPTDANGISGTPKAFSLTINVAPSITTGSPLPGVTTGGTYSQPLATSGGTGAIACARTSGSLSGSGLTLNSNCTITGTAATAATYSFSVTPTDADFVAGSPASFSLTVSPSAPSAGIGTSLRGGAVLRGRAKAQ